MQVLRSLQRRLRGNQLPASEPVEVTTAAGDRTFVVLVPPGHTDPVVEALRAGQHLNPHLEEVIRRFSPAGGRFADFGSHVGSVALAAAAAGRQVLAVDAVPDFVQLINASAERNGFGDLRAQWAAVGDHDGTVRFAANGPFGQVARSGDDGVEVPLRRGTRLLEERGWDRVDVIKVDVEGSEPEAFAGLAPLLARDDAPVVVYESNGFVLNERGSSPAAVRRQLADLGYALYRFEGDRYAETPVDEAQVESFIDILAVKPAHHAALEGHVRPALTHDELAARALAQSQEGVPVQRRYVAEVLTDPELPWRDHPSVQEALRRLAADPDPTVSSAVTPAS